MFTEKQKKEILHALEELENQLNDPTLAKDQRVYRKTAQEYTRIKEVADALHAYENKEKMLQELERQKQEERDEEMQMLIREEQKNIQQQQQEHLQCVERFFYPPDPLDQKDIIIEIRAGTGGDEAALFAAELFRMYTRFADRHGWKTHLISAHRIGIGGLKEVILEMHGTFVYKHLKYESGVHRVQRVPETEKNGRVHTSTATVAVLPEVDDIDITIDPKDLDIQASTSQGAGGQSVNTTYSAVRITHLPTGIMVSCQDERSFQQNKAKGLQVLRARLFAHEQAKRQQALRETRRAQIGAGERAEKIRTYNFPQDRITDHRLEKNFHNIEDVLDGNLDAIIAALTQSNAL